MDYSNDIRGHTKPNKTSVSAEMKKAIGEQLEKIAIVHLFQEKLDKSKNIRFTDLCESFVYLSERINQRACANPLKALKYSFMVFENLLLMYQTEQVMIESPRDEAEKTVFSSGLKEKTVEYRNTVSCPPDIQDPARLLKEHVSETMEDEVIQGSHKDLNYSHVTNAEIGIKVCFAVEKSIKCSKYSSV